MRRVKEATRATWKPFVHIPANDEQGGREASEATDAHVISVCIAWMG